jgi:hypothetical protein
MLWNQNVHYRIHNRTPSVPILSQFNPVYLRHPTSWRSILILFSTYAWVFQVIILFRSSHQNTVSISSLLYMCHMPRQSRSCFDQPHDIFCVQQQITKCLVFSLLHSPIASYLSGPNIFLSTPFSNMHCLYVSFGVKVRASIWRTWNLTYLNIHE